MKFYETHFEDYINASEKQNLHPKFKKQLECLPSECEQIKNIIVYGAAGIGKYTQTLNIIKHYSPSKLKYEKKISIVFNKQPFFFKISDIHFEVDLHFEFGVHFDLFIWVIFMSLVFNLNLIFIFGKFFCYKPIE